MFNRYTGKLLAGIYFSKEKILSKLWLGGNHFCIILLILSFVRVDTERTDEPRLETLEEACRVR